MLETHPFELYVPEKIRYLLLGSFTGRMNSNYDWYYSNGRNQFWPIVSKVYALELKTKEEKQVLFSRLRLGVGDIIYQCERQKGNNADMNLVNIVYNLEPIGRLLARGTIEKIYFSSRFVENKFRRIFREILEKYPVEKLITLPSPSPRYAQMTFSQKVERFKELLPVLPGKI